MPGQWHSQPTYVSKCKHKLIMNKKVVHLGMRGLEYLLFGITSVISDNFRLAFSLRSKKS